LRALLVAPISDNVTDLPGVFARASWADGNVDIPFLNAGGLGILIGDGHLSNPGLEKSLEPCYSYAPTPSTRLTLDQFVSNPGYNADLGPAARYRPYDTIGSPPESSHRGTTDCAREFGKWHETDQSVRSDDVRSSG
jgi:hypothetical protein